jgi:hypothetical protein
VEPPPEPAPPAPLGAETVIVTVAVFELCPPAVAL